MTLKDYAKKVPPKKGHKRARHGDKQSMTLWIVACILLGLFIIGLSYLKHERAKQHAQEILAEKKEEQANKSRKLHSEEKSKLQLQAESTSAQQPHFDFYTMLPDSSKTHPAQVKANQVYILQVGAFQDYQTADQLKARLVLEGYEVKLSPVKKDSGTWYRVWLGPFTTRTDAAKQQAQLLQQNQVKSEIVYNPHTDG